MGLRFRKSITLCKGVKINLGKNGVSLSAGIPGFRKTWHLDGRETTSVGLPGTGLSYVTIENKNHTQHSNTRSRGRGNNTILSSYNDYEAEHDPTFERVKTIQPSQIKEPQLFPRQEITPATLKSIHKVSDEQVDWTEVLVNPFPPDDMYNKELWNYYHSIAPEILNGNIDAYLKIIQDINPLDDLLDFGSDFEFGTDDPSSLEVEFRVKSSDVMPPKGNMSTIAYYELLQDYICSCTIRVARDMLALLPVKRVIVHAEDNNQTILSVCFDRPTMTGIKFHFADPSDVVERFEHHMEFEPARGFSPIRRIKS